MIFFFKNYTKGLEEPSRGNHFIYLKSLTLFKVKLFNQSDKLSHKKPRGFLKKGATNNKISKKPLGFFEKGAADDKIMIYLE